MEVIFDNMDNILKTADLVSPLSVELHNKDKVFLLDHKQKALA